MVQAPSDEPLVHNLQKSCSAPASACPEALQPIDSASLASHTAMQQPWSAGTAAIPTAIGDSQVGRPLYLLARERTLHALRSACITDDVGCSRLVYSHTLPCNNSHGTSPAALTDLTCCSQQDDGGGVVNSPAQLQASTAFKTPAASGPSSDKLVPAFGPVASQAPAALPQTWLDCQEALRFSIEPRQEGKDFL